MVNKREYDYESIRIEVTGSGLITSGQDVSYNAEKKSKLVFNTDGSPRGFTQDEDFAGDFSVTVSLAEYGKLSESMKGKGGILNHAPVKVVISYGNDDQPLVTDTLTVKLGGVKNAPKKGDAVMRELSGIITDIPEFAGHRVWEPIKRQEGGA